MSQQQHRVRAPLALSVGEPAGVGPDILLAAWRLRAERGIPAFYVLADPDMLRRRARRCGLDIAIAETTQDEAASAFMHALPVVRLENGLEDNPGLADRASAPGVIESIGRAVEDTMAGRADAVVTCPIAKKPLYDAGFDFPGHTEFLGHLAGLASGKPAVPVMMMAGPDLRTVPVTVHIALRAVPAAVTTERIVEVGRIVARDLRMRFGIAAPRLAVSGLNPHAGEGGAMGEEDERIVRPAIETLREEAIDVIGPLPADTMFHESARAAYDAALCMYHDQALIPVKTLAFDDTVNVTLGLPFIRTSPDHGTAFDIAGKGVARPDSLIAALKLARQLADTATDIA